MPIGQSYLPEFDLEMTNTRKLLERVPSDKAEWKPHPKSFALGHLAQLVAWMPGWIEQTLKNPFLDLKAGGGYSMEKTETLVAMLDENIRKARAALESTPDAEWSKTWELKMGGQTVWAAPRAVVVRNHLNHLIHHRAQLTVYLRLLDVPIPGLYGPSADDKSFGLP